MYPPYPASRVPRAFRSSRGATGHWPTEGKRTRAGPKMLSTGMGFWSVERRSSLSPGRKRVPADGHGDDGCRWFAWSCGCSPSALASRRRTAELTSSKLAHVNDRTSASEVGETLEGVICSTHRQNHMTSISFQADPAGTYLVGNGEAESFMRWT
jgi:hypothetical protein